MNVVKITADSPQEALEQVHKQLGPEAVVLDVRKLPASGVKKLWTKAQVEVTASGPEPKSDDHELIAQLNSKIEQLEDQLLRNPVPKPSPEPQVNFPSKAAELIKASQAGSPVEGEGGVMPAVKILKRLGLLPSHARWLSGQATNYLGFTKPRNLPEEFALVRETLTDYWHQLVRRQTKPGNPVRLMVGTPGTGKTTCMCKWMTQEVLLRNKSVRAWRLDGSMANTAEFLNVHGEVLRVPVERFWDDTEEIPGDTMRFVDLPGVSAGDREARRALVEQVKALPLTETYLVLNASYDLGLLLNHARFFSVLPLSGLILTHLDEETRWSKCWNLVLATQLPILYLSGGQNIPGDFHPAMPEVLFDNFVKKGQDQLD